MAMDRAQMLSIINALADDKLMAALDAAGIQTGGEALELGAEEAPGLEPWSEKEVQVEPANKPTLFDKNKFIKQPPVVIRRPQYMPQEEPMSDIAAYVTPEGTI
jgi:hypothetical protein